MIIHWGKFLAMVIAAMGLGACGARPESEWPRLRLVVSDDARQYTGGLAESLEDFKKRVGVATDVEVVSTSRVLARLEAAPIPDMVLTCNPAMTRAMVGKGLAGPEKWLIERRRDRVALVARADDPTTAARLEDLARPEMGTVGLTDHVHSNVGYVTDLALRQTGVFPKIQRRIRYYESQDGLMEGMRRGEARVGFIRETSLKHYGPGVKALLIFDPVELSWGFPLPGGALPTGSPPRPYVAFAVNRRSAQPVRAHQCWGGLEMFFRNPAMYLIDASEAGNMFRLENLAD